MKTAETKVSNSNDNTSDDSTPDGIMIPRKKNNIFGIDDTNVHVKREPRGNSLSFLNTVKPKKKQKKQKRMYSSQMSLVFFFLFLS